MENTDSLVATLSDLRKRGYDVNLNFETDIFALYGSDLDMRLNPDEFHVDEIDRVGNDDRPNDGDIVYAISTQIGIKGIIVDTPKETDNEKQSSLNEQSCTIQPTGRI